MSVVEEARVTLVSDTSKDIGSIVPTLYFDRVTRQFSGGRGIRAVTLTIRPGTICALIGANGSGKTTVLRCACLFERLDAGCIQLNGAPWAGGGAISNGAINPDRIRGSILGFVAQNAEPWPNYRVLDNIMMPLIRTGKFSKAEARVRAESELHRFGLEDRSLAFPSQLSGGIRQRVVLARAFALRPRILLLDEATSALDPDWTERVRQIIREFADTGGTALIINHQINLVRRLSDWVGYLNHGQLVEEGSPGNILDSPSDLSLQKFLANA